MGNVEAAYTRQPSRNWRILYTDNMILKAVID